MTIIVSGIAAATGTTGATSGAVIGTATGLATGLAGKIFGSGAGIASVVAGAIGVSVSAGTILGSIFGRGVDLFGAVTGGWRSRRRSFEHNGCFRACYYFGPDWLAYTGCVT